MNKEELVQEIIENLSRCQRAPGHDGWQKIGLSHAQVSMLFMLYYHPEASPKQLADHLGISKSAISQLLDPLVDKKMVRRQNDPNDRRIVRLHLTSIGKKALKEVHKLKYAGIRSALNELSEHELKQMTTLCQKMARESQKEKD